MGKPNAGNTALFIHESIVYEREPGELKHLSTRRKRKKTSISKVVASEMDRAQTVSRNIYGVMDPKKHFNYLIEQAWKAWPKRVKASYMKDD